MKRLADMRCIIGVSDRERLALGDLIMTEQQFKLEIPAQVKEVAEKTIDQAERGFSAFIEAANKSVSMTPNPATDMSLLALAHTEQNMKAAFDHAKKLVQAKDLQEAMRLQAEFLKAQYDAATEQLKELGNSMHARKSAKAGEQAAEDLRDATAKEEAKIESKTGHDLAKGADRFEERSKSSDGNSAVEKQKG
jgi:phasin